MLAPGVEGSEQKIVIGSEWATFPPDFRNSRFQQIAWPGGRRLGPICDAIIEVRINRTGNLTVVTEHVFPDFVRHGRISLFAHHIEDGLRHDELRKGADNNRITQLATYARSLLKYLWQAVSNPEGRKLRLQIGHHSTRHLMLVMKRVVFNDAANRLALAFGNVAQAFGDLMYRFQVDRCAESGASYVLDEPFGCRMGCTIGQRRCRGVDHIDAELHSAARGIWRKSGKTMRVQMTSQLAANSCKRRLQHVNPFRRQQAARILDVDGIDAERHELACLSHIVIVSVDGAYSVNDPTRGIEADSLGCPNRHLHVA